MLSPRPSHLGQLVGGLEGASCVAQDGLLLMMYAVSSVVRGAELMQCEAHYFPARSASSCDKDAEESDEEIAIALTEGYGSAKDASTRPVDPWTGMCKWYCRLRHCESVSSL